MSGKILATIDVMKPLKIKTFDDKEEHKKFVEYQEKKNIIADALEESGVGHG